MSRLISALLAVVLIGLAIVLIGPVAATVLTPGWAADADARDWASMLFFLCVAAVFLLIALRLPFRARSARGGLRSHDWWAVAILSLAGSVAAAIASHWMIALPGLIPITVAVVLARRRARQERLALVESDPSAGPPPASFTARTSPGSRST